VVVLVEVADPRYHHKLVDLEVQVAEDQVMVPPLVLPEQVILPLLPHL
jgi:hypothetical protein